MIFTAVLLPWSIAVCIKERGDICTHSFHDQKRPNVQKDLWEDGWEEDDEPSDVFHVKGLSIYTGCYAHERSQIGLFLIAPKEGISQWEET